MSEQLHFIHGAFGVKIHSFVLMSNHFHLLMSTPRSNLSSAMEWFMRETSRDLTRAGNRINQTYGGSHYRSILGSNHYFLNAYKYNYYNPVKARICADVLRYPYSTLAGKLGLSKMLIPVDDDLTLFSDVEGTLSWLNRPPNEKMWKAMRLALHRKEFKLSKVNGKPHPLETDAL